VHVGELVLLCHHEFEHLHWQMVIVTLYALSEHL
jgi:hypothetical protein